MYQKAVTHYITNQAQRRATLRSAGLVVGWATAFGYLSMLSATHGLAQWVATGDGYGHAHHQGRGRLLRFATTTAQRTTVSVARVFYTTRDRPRASAVGLLQQSPSK